MSKRKVSSTAAHLLRNHINTILLYAALSSSTWGSWNSISCPFSLSCHISAMSSCFLTGLKRSEGYASLGSNEISVSISMGCCSRSASVLTYLSKCLRPVGLTEMIHGDVVSSALGLAISTRRVFLHALPLLPPPAEPHSFCG